MNKKTKL